MRVAIFSDTHLGFGYGTERYEDSFNAFREALYLARGSDLVVIPGDIFDSKNPTTETLSKAMEMLLELRMSQTGAKLAEGIDRRISEISPVNYMGMPVVALYGNHERRAKGLVNPVQVLEKAGLLIHVHCNGLVFESAGERVAIQGMSAVPDQFAKETLQQWSPKPISGAYNILMMHQVFSEFFQAPGAIPSSVLPPGFDLYVDGDIHKPSVADVRGRPFVVAGSLFPTQLNKDETTQKGVWILNTASKEFRFQPLQKQRKFYFLEYKSPTRKQIQDDVENILVQPHDKPPIIRVKSMSDFEWQGELETRFQGKALLSFRKGGTEKLMQGVPLADHIASVEETASRLLRANLTEAGLDASSLEQVFELLAEKRHEDALELIVESVNKAKEEKTK